MFRERAHAAIEAMREPTAAMEDAADNDGPWRFQQPASVWRVMIDAALTTSKR